MTKNKKLLNGSKILITGAAGMLSQSVYDIFYKRYKLMCTDIIINEPWIAHLDVRNRQEFVRKVKEFQPDFIFHFAAETDLEICETNKKYALETNYVGVLNAIEAAQAVGAVLVFTSTAGIFNGEKNNYTEADEPSPLCYYAETKYLAEKAVRAQMKNYYILRPGWMMGGGMEKDKKFVAKIVKQLLEGVEELSVVGDRYGTPTYARDLSMNLDFLLRTGRFGIYHMVNQGDCSRYEVAQEIVKFLGYDKVVKINKVTSDYFKREYFAARPFSEALVNGKLKMNNLEIMDSWKNALRRYLRRDFTACKYHAVSKYYQKNKFAIHA